VFVLISQAASAYSASQRPTSAVYNQSHEHKQGERGLEERDYGRISVPRPELMAQLPEAQNPGANITLPSAEGQKSKPDIVVPPSEAQTSKPQAETTVR